MGRPIGVQREIDVDVLFTVGGNATGHSKKICKVRFNTYIRKYFFSNCIIGR